MSEKRVIAVIYEDGEPAIVGDTSAGVVRAGAAHLVAMVDNIGLAPKPEPVPNVSEPVIVRQAEELGNV